MKMRILACLMSLVILLSLLPVGAMAVTVTASGTCGDNVTWTLDSDGVLTISGTGEMWNYLDAENELPTLWSARSTTSSGRRPAADYGRRIYRIVVEEGVTSIGDSAFLFCSEATSVTIANSVTRIGKFAFAECNSISEITIPAAVTTIGERAFHYCTGLTRITFNGNAPTMGFNILYPVITTAYYPENNTTWTSGKLTNHGGTLTWVPYETEAEDPDETEPENPEPTVTVPMPTDPYTVASGTCGEGLTWTLDSNGLLTVSGYGAIPDISLGEAFTGYNGPVWWFNRTQAVITIVVEDGVTAIGTEVFLLGKATSITIPVSVTRIASDALPYGKLTDIYYAGSKEQWEAIDLGSNECLATATIHYGLTHNFVAGVVTAPDCTNQGYTTYSCTDCGFSYPDDWVPALGHQWQAGSCTECGETPTGVVITAQPADALAFSGDKAVVTVAAQGDGLTYAWYYANKNASAFTYTDSFQTGRYSITMNAARTGRRIYCVITDMYGNSVKSDTVTLGMKTPLTVTRQPVDTTVAFGEKATVSVTAKGDGLTYAWYYANKWSDTFTYTDSFKTSRYSVPMNSVRNGRRVYCVVTDQYGNSMRTDTVTLRMVTPLQVAPLPAAVSAAFGEKAVVTVQAQGDGLTYQWYYANVGKDTFTYTDSFKSNRYSVTMNDARAGRGIYCVITDQYGNSVKTNTVTLGMAIPVRITGQPVDVTVASGEKAVVTVVAQGDGLTYQWYYANAGFDIFTLTTTFTGCRYTVAMTDSRAGRRVYCVVTDRYGNSVKSEIVTLLME